MIDSKRLDELEAQMRAVYSGLDMSTVPEHLRGENPLVEQVELLRLARLGLWAREHEVGSLIEDIGAVINGGSQDMSDIHQFSNQIFDARAALPKGVDDGSR